MQISSDILLLGALGAFIGWLLYRRRMARADRLVQERFDRERLARLGEDPDLLDPADGLEREQALAERLAAFRHAGTALAELTGRPPPKLTLPEAPADPLPLPGPGRGLQLGRHPAADYGGDPGARGMTFRQTRRLRPSRLDLMADSMEVPPLEDQPTVREDSSGMRPAGSSDDTDDQEA